jgi:transposase InsO family protein
VKEISEIHKRSRGTYGSPRVFKTLKDRGYSIGKKRVERLMRNNGLVGRVVLVTRRQPGLKQFKAAGENLLRFEPRPTKLNQAWVADITYLKLGRKWRYLATVMDVYSRRIIGWSLSSERTTDLTLNALSHALKGRKLENGMIFHTDRGIEYTAYRFRDELKKHGIRHSVNRPGICTDNAYMESFFHTLKAELIRGRRFMQESELRFALNSYINQFYNHRRMHSGIGYIPPAVFERMAA